MTSEHAPHRQSWTRRMLSAVAGLREGRGRRDRAGPELRRLLSLIQPHRGWMLLASALAFVTATLSLALPLGIRELMDSVLSDSDRAKLHLIALVLMGLFVVRAAFSFGTSYLIRMVGERIVVQLRLRLFRHLHGLSLRFFADQRVGDLTSRLASDAAAVRSAVTDGLLTLLMQSLRLCGAVTIMFMMNWRLTLLVLSVGPAAALVSRIMGHRIQALATGIHDRLADTTATAQESLDMIHVVQGFGRGPYEVRQYGSALQRLYDTTRRAVLTSSLFSSVIDLIFISILVGLFWYGGLEVLDGRMTAGTLLAFLFYAQDISNSISSLTKVYMSFKTASGASRRIFEILDQEPEIRDRPGARDLTSVQGRVAFRNVWFGYRGGAPVLRGVDFEAEPGEMVAIVGRSGAGKSTLLHLIPRFYDPDHGAVLIDGVDAREIRMSSLRERIAVVPQDVQLFGKTVAENICYGRLRASRAEIEAAACSANADEFIRELPDAYDARIGQRGVKLSGGQRQRIAIARALLREARIILLDEATSSVDSESEGAVQNALLRLRGGPTLFIVAHRLATVRSADRIIVLQDGVITEIGTHDELLQRGGAYWLLARQQFHDGERRLETV